MSDELSTTPLKTEKPMQITHKKNHSPFKTLSARRVALRYEEEAIKTIEELIKKKSNYKDQRDDRLVQPGILRRQGRQN